MSVNPRALLTSTLLPSAETTQVTSDSPGTHTILDKVTAYNGSGSSVTVTIKLVPNGGSAGAGHMMATKSLATLETYTFPEVVGQILEPGGFLSTTASTGSVVVFRVSGRKVT